MKKKFFDKIPFLIAEISANHCGKLNLAKKLILEAKKNGANAVKLQTYKPDSLTLKSKKKYFKIKQYKLCSLGRSRQNFRSRFCSSNKSNITNSSEKKTNTIIFCNFT